MVGECFSFPLEVASIAPGKHKVAVREKKKFPLENKYIFSSSFEVSILHLRLCCMDSINFLKTSVVMLKE